MAGILKQVSPNAPIDGHLDGICLKMHADIGVSAYTLFKLMTHRTFVGRGHHTFQEFTALICFAGFECFIFCHTAIRRFVGELGTVDRIGD